MHTPDGFLTNWICVLFLLLSSIPIALALKNLRKNLTNSKIMAIATVSAIIFLGQMLNFPIAEGTSGHMIGAALALFILGIDGAVISMALVLVTQTLVFGDGGTLALGANIFNMGIVAIYSANFVMNRLQANELVKRFVASWFSVLVASIVCAIELALSGTVSFLPALTAMATVHAIIGIGEGLITVAISTFTNKLQNLSWKLALTGTGVSFLIVAILLPFASGEPDGLERVAINLGFFNAATEFYSAPIMDYALAGFGTTLGGILAALIGAVSVFAAGYTVATLTKA
ncbi:MAG: energy-coupling factor ABC transporter permease [Candidatus Micrarchaeota archaeon]